MRLLALLVSAIVMLSALGWAAHPPAPVPRTAGDSECYDLPESVAEMTLEKEWRRASSVDRATLTVRRSRGEVELRTKRLSCYVWFNPRPGQTDYKIITVQQVWWRPL